MNDYSTIQGDAWDLISRKVYGDEYLVNLLLDANPQYKTVIVFSGGIKLVVPDAPERALVSNNLPPWRGNASKRISTGNAV